MDVERKIDRKSFEPPYLQLVNILQDQIAENPGVTHEHQ